MQQQQLNSSNMSAMPLFFCINGGKCAKSAPNSGQNVFEQSADCACTGDFDGPHCELLRYDQVSHDKYNGGDGGGLVSQNRTQSRIDDMINGDLIRDDDQLLDEHPTPAPDNPRIQTRTWWILASLTGVCLLALAIVLRRKRSKRRERSWRSAEHLPEIVPPVSLPNHPAAKTHLLDLIKRHLFDMQERNGTSSCTSMLDPKRKSVSEIPAIQKSARSQEGQRIGKWMPNFMSRRCRIIEDIDSPSVLAATSTGQQSEPIFLGRNGNTDYLQGSKEACTAIERGESGDEEPEVIDDEEEDDDEILVGTFDNYVPYGPGDLSDGSQGEALPYAGGLLTNSSIDPYESAIMRGTVGLMSSAFSTFQASPTSFLEIERDVVIESICDETEKDAESSSSYSYSSTEWSQSFLDDSLRSQTRIYDSYSPDSLYTSTTERESDTERHIAQLKLSASFSDYSSFPDTLTDGVSLSTTLDGLTNSSEDGSSATSLTVDISEQP
jgi:hypothetical protein